MTDGVTPAVSTHSATLRSQRICWASWTALAFPVAVLSHELAHYVAYRLFGFPGPALHYGSASHAVSSAFWQLMKAGDIAAASRLLPPWQAGVAAAAGLAASYLTVLACILVARRRPHPFVVGLGLIAAGRFIGSVVVALMVLLGKRGNGSDEEHVAMTLPIPEALLHALGIAVLVVSWVVLLRIAAREIKRGRLAVLAGIVVGGVFYISVVGPWLLP
jgi:hypothetical protein